MFTLSRGAIVSFLLTLLVLLLAPPLARPDPPEPDGARGAPGRGPGLRDLDRPRAAAGPGSAGGLLRRCRPGPHDAPDAARVPAPRRGARRLRRHLPALPAAGARPRQGRTTRTLTTISCSSRSSSGRWGPRSSCGWAGGSAGISLEPTCSVGRRCPVGRRRARGGAAPGDPFSVGLGVGAVGSVLALLVHSVFDFAARIPANGILAATCLGIATVALHTRFQPTGERLLTRVPRGVAGGPPGLARALGAVAIVCALAAVLWIVRPPLVPGRLADGRASGHRSRHRPATGRGCAGPGSARRTRPGPPRSAAARRRGGDLEFGADPGWAGPVNAGTSGDRPAWLWRAGAAAGLRRPPSRRSRPTPGSTTVERAPSGPRRCSIPQNAPRHLDCGAGLLLPGGRAGSRDPFPYWTLAVFAVPQGGRYTEIGLRAAQGAVERDPELLAGSRRPVSPAPPQRRAVGGDGPRVGDSTGRSSAPRWRSGDFSSEAAHAYRSAIEVASAGQAPLTLDAGPPRAPGETPP